MTKEDSKTDQRVALVTGANCGLGLAAAHGLVEHGCIVWLGVRNVEASPGILTEFSQYADRVVLVALDVTDPGHIAQAYQDIANRHEKLDILVNNAGIMLDGGWVAIRR